ncbi:hypothetical protein LCGC14_0508480 [marine sediment metagenome]|uniref:Flavodoxin domain-containing protein n=1 Tax=marine sediment metagenome TaxID=412755 RepID=A0A0F9SKE5_9ZZZZ
MKLWIIYKNGIGFSKIIAEMLQDSLEEFIDVAVGEAKKIDPALLVEEKLDYMIVGDIISKEIPSLDIQNWLLKYREVSKKKIKVISVFNVVLTDISVNSFWVKFLQDNVIAETIYPSIIRLKLNKADLAFKNGVHEIVKEYSDKFIEFIIKKIKNKKINKKLSDKEEYL